MSVLGGAVGEIFEELYINPYSTTYVIYLFYGGERKRSPFPVKKWILIQTYKTQKINLTTEWDERMLRRDRDLRSVGHLE